MNKLDLDFIEKAKAAHPDFFRDKKILEIGALDVNGNVRGPFKKCTFTGIDWAPGKNVDIVVPAKDTTFDNEVFDVMLSANHLEHDPDWELSLGNNLPALKPGGLILLRWGTRRSSPHGPEFDPHGKLGYYPKDLPEVHAFLVANGCRVLDEYCDQNPSIGIMGNIIAKKL